ncbi:MAG: hypothetical protein GXP11_10570, partial [Gammaproteobacteria bacterium]|nr:hypothetical protein [Gammaproteobacteria bacterium]
MPLVASAMGFGNIKLNSALNEPLNADIELLSASVDDVSGLTVKLASREAFLRAGVDRPAFLTTFKMEIKSRADDTYYIHLSSAQPVREPFLNFLLELSWYNGRILREYTVLLDPPGRVVKQPAVIATPEVTQPAQIARAPEPEPVPTPAIEPEPVPVPESAPVVSELPAKKEVVAPPEPAAEETVSKPESIQTAAEVLPKPENGTEPLLAAATAGAVVAGGSSAFSDDGELFPRIPLTDYHENKPAQAPKSESIAQGKLDYGITRKGDNLWTVAKKLQAGDESVSIYQIMMALLKNNPDAFRGGNINRLKIGHVLRIEDPAMLQAMSDSEARAAYRIQTEEWEHYHQDLAAAANAPQAIVAGDLGAPADKGEVDSGGELTVAAPSGKELTAGEGLADTALSGDVATLKEELDQLRSDAEAMGGTDAALNKQIKDMESELADMQRAISVQDTELAAVQQMAQKADESNNEEKTVATETAPETPAVTEEKVATEETSVAEAETESKSEPTPAAVQEAPASEAETAVETTPAAVTKPAVQQVPAPVVAPLPVPIPEQKTGFMNTVTGMLATIAATLSGMLGSLAGNSLLLFVGLPILLVLIILMAIVIRRRKQAQGGFQESILSGESSSVDADQAEAKEEESSFLSDFAVSGAGAIQAEDSEVDPLTEADVFMAYGRYEAAEERLTEAMEDDPSRKELKLKLLELYNATKNQTAFESTAENFYASLGENANTDPMWEKVLSMGKELAPDNPLFTGDVLVPAASDSAPAEDVGGSLSDSQVMDIGLETGVFQAEELEPAKDEASGLDFNLDLDDLSEPEKTETDFVLNDELIAAEDSGLDFNLDLDSNDSDSNTVESSEPPTAEMEMPTEETDTGLEFNLDTGLDTNEAESELAMDADGLDFKIDGDDETSVDLQVEEDSTGLDLSFELDEPADAVAQDDNQDSSDLEFSLDTGEASHDTDEVVGSDEIDHTMVINLDDSDVAIAEDEDTALDLNLDDAETPAEGSTEDALADDVLAIDLGESLASDSIDSDGEDTAADLSLDTEETS